jgi:hypothetical protein
MTYTSKTESVVTGHGIELDDSRLRKRLDEFLTRESNDGWELVSIEYRKHPATLDGEFFRDGYFKYEALVMMRRKSTYPLQTNIFCYSALVHEPGLPLLPIAIKEAAGGCALMLCSISPRVTRALTVFCSVMRRQRRHILSPTDPIDALALT